mmetsp:Transcript_90697/g.194519  ORF Transcript_90697/g.194519 Transcript_90697/m.194519 type:complete len:344 (+) Transcript_90697:105-1136(+)
MAAIRAMGKTASTVGMMEGAFFVSRTDLLAWVNGLLQVNLTKVEQCANGAIYCQILDSCSPNTVAMKKVNWMAKTDHEFIPNYKVLQQAFDKNCIERHIDVDKLIRAKYQDNLEFLQWMKCYWDREGSNRDDYDPILAREGKSVQPWARGCSVGGVGAGAIRERNVEKENLRPRAPAAPREGKIGGPAAAMSGRTSPAAPLATSRPTSAKAVRPLSGGSGEVVSQRVVEDLNAKIGLQQEELHDLRGTLDGLERERDYYFRKLRDVEILCSTLQARMPPDTTAIKVVEDVQGILYAENEEEAEVGAQDAERIASEEAEEAAMVGEGAGTGGTPCGTPRRGSTP